MKDDILAFNEKQFLKAIKKSWNLKHARYKQCFSKEQLLSFIEEDVTQIHNRDCIVTCCVEFYQELYKSRRLPTYTTEPQQPHRLAMDDAPPIILPTEVEALIKKLDHSKAPGEDNITGGVIQEFGSCSQPSHSTLQQMSSTAPSSKAWQNTMMVLLHKRGSISDIKNYRPISLLTIIYKVFSHILLKWIL